MGDTFNDVLTASDLSTMIRCVQNTDMVTYDYTSGKLWKCPTASSGRYVYLYAEHSGMDLIEVEVYTRNMPSSFMETCGHDEG